MTKQIIPRSILSPIECGALENAETTIRDNLSGFIAVGAALRRIRTKKLYRGTHETFEDYCQERFDIGRRYANQQIAAAAVAGDLPDDQQRPTNEWQLRPLLKLETSSQQRRAWSDACNECDGHPSSAAVARAVAKVSGSVAKKKVARASKKTKCKACGGTGYEPEPTPRLLLRVPARKKKTTKPRARDPVWDVICELFKFSPKTKSEGTRVGRIVRDLKIHGATEDEIRRRYRAFCERFDKPQMQTMEAFLKHWQSFDVATEPSDQGDAQVAETQAMLREAQGGG